MNRNIILTLSFITLLAGCATQSHRTVAVEPMVLNTVSYSGPKTTIVVGDFSNKSDYMQGLFSSNTDKLGSQAKVILKTLLQQSNRFKVVDRQNMAQIAVEAKLRGIKQNIKGARYTITGAVTEFGRKTIGDKQLFGILGAGKSQIAYSKISLNIVDVLTSEVIYSTQGAGEYELNSRQVIGFGSSAGYDSTLNGKVLDFSIKQTVNNMIRDLENGTLKVEL
ncbi:MAG: CsgG/HfaB family protein [Gammaproteobacteria bacterium]|nr:CsgG/HfaB family protein [Gammaproteobacteria bacterium]